MAPRKTSDRVASLVARLHEIPRRETKRIWGVCAAELRYLKYNRWPKADGETQEAFEARTKRTRKNEIVKYRNAIREDKALGESHPALKYLRLNREDQDAIAEMDEAVVYERHHQLRPIDADALIRRALHDAVHGEGMLVRLAGLQTLTGRRTVEIVLTGRFTAIPGNDRELRFSGQAKTRGAASAQTGAYIIPVLASARSLLAALHGVRDDIGPIEDRPASKDAFGNNVPARTAEQIVNDRFASNIGRIMTGRHLADPPKIPPYHDENSQALSPSDLRTAYAAIAYTRYAPANMTVIAYIARILGHSDGDYKTALSYMEFYVVGQKRDLEADARRGFTDALRHLEQQRDAADTDSISKEQLTTSIDLLRSYLGKDSSK